MQDLIDFLRFLSGILKRWIAEIWMVFIFILGENYCFSLVEAKYSAVSLGAILYKENYSSCFHLVYCIHCVYQNFAPEVVACFSIFSAFPFYPSGPAQSGGGLLFREVFLMTFPLVSASENFILLSVVLCFLSSCYAPLPCS